MSDALWTQLKRVQAECRELERMIVMENPDEYRHLGDDYFKELFPHHKIVS